MSDLNDNTLHPPYAVLQALIESSLKYIRLLGVQSTGEEIVQRLGTSEDPLEQLARVELGNGNYEISVGPRGGRLVRLKSCPFQAMVNQVGPWSENAKLMVTHFNASPRGGAALHPICIAHLSIRDAYGATNLGCRSMTSGKMAISVQALLDTAGVTEQEVRERLEGNACLYWLR